MYGVLHVVLEELETLLDGSLPLLEVLEECLSEELDQLDERMVGHVLQMLTNCIELRLVFGRLCIDYT